MNLTVLSLLIAFAGYSVQNISQASQKIGFLRMKKDRKTGMIIWGAATVGTGLSTLILLTAVSLGQVSLVGAMAGTGLVSMTIYSRFVIKEIPGKNKMAGSWSNYYWSIDDNYEKGRESIPNWISPEIMVMTRRHRLTLPVILWNLRNRGFISLSVFLFVYL
jgi:uncharacterized membrane protein